MKMLVSDYDNTFFTNEESIKKNVSIIKKFMENNIFVIATGRAYDSFIKKANLYNIKFNYLVTNHGATIFSKRKIIYNETINNEIKESIISILIKYNIVEKFACSNDNSNAAFEDKNLTKIHVRYKSVEIAQKINDELLKKYKKYINTFIISGGRTIEIVSNKVNKASAVEFLKRLEKLDKSQIYTIGDDTSDIKMIKNYNGYTMMNSIEELDKIAIKKYNNVYELVEEII